MPFTDYAEEAIVELASDPGDTMPTCMAGEDPVSDYPQDPAALEAAAAIVRPMPKRCEFMVAMDPKGEPRHQCPNPPVLLMELDLGFSPTYRWACDHHANERLVPLKVMIVRRFKGKT